MDHAGMPPILQLVPGSQAAACIIKHLSKHDRQQFALSCKHARLLAVAAITKLTLSHKWYNGKRCRTAFPKCVCIAMKPRTMEELSKLMSELLLHSIKLLPALSDLRLEMQGVYDKQNDLSLIIKSIPLHTAQLAALCIEQAAMLPAKTAAILADMPLLSTLTIKNVCGFEVGALSKLSNIAHLTSLHLEIVDAVGVSSSSGSSTAVPTTSSTSCMTPSELARLQASDEVGLAKCTKLVSLTAINLTKAGSLRPVSTLLEAIAGSLKPKLSRLVLGNMPDLPANTLDILSGICSLTELSLAGCDAAGTAELAKLSSLTALSELCIAPQHPPAAALAALAKGCRHLANLAMSAHLMQPAVFSMNNVTELQLLAASPLGAAATAAAVAAAAGAGMSLRVRPPIQLSSLHRNWPSLKALDVSGWALDALGVAALQQLEGLESLKLVGGSEAGTALHAKLLLPLLEMPQLSKLLLLEVTDLTDEWLGEAVRNVAVNGYGTFCAVKELHLGAVVPPAAAPAVVGAAGAGVAAAAAAAAAAASGSAVAGSSSAAAGTTGAGVGTGSTGSTCGGQTVTDRGLVRLFACPKLQKLVLVQLPGVSLAGVKALVRGSSTLQAVDLVGCPAVSAAAPDVIARAAIAAPDRVVDLTVR